jgi:predicted ester cyclase
VIDEIVTPDYVLHDPTTPDGVRGPDGAKEMVDAYRSAFDLRMTVEHQFADGEFVATRYTASGRHSGEFMGVPATGREATVPGICISRCRDGKVVEEWEIWHALGVLGQLGLVPQPAS